MVHNCPYGKCFSICAQVRKGVKGFTVTHFCENKTVRYATKREATAAAKAIDRDRYGGTPTVR